MAILAAFNSPEVEVIGMTSLFGNVRTPMATANAVFLRELAGRHDVRADAPLVECTVAGSLTASSQTHLQHMEIILSCSQLLCPV